MDAVHVELRGTIIEVDTILLLLNVCELCEGITPYIVSDVHQCINLTFKTCIELLERMRWFAITPRSIAVASLCVLTLYPLDTTKLIEHIRHVSLVVSWVIVRVVLYWTVETNICARHIEGIVRSLEPTLTVVDSIL